MIPRIGIAVMAAAVVLAVGCGQDKKNAVQEERAAKVLADRKHVEEIGTWVYDDLPRAIETAKAKNLPLLVVFRCIPCEACAKLDLEVVEGQAMIKPLLSKFVCCRVPHMNGVDLSIFQFDFDQSFAAFMMNADGTIYGRYGTRSHQTKSDEDVSIEGFAKALEAALGIHAGYPKNAESLASHRGAALAVRTPEEFPFLKARFGPALDWKGNVAQSCIHCHQVGVAERLAARATARWIPEKILWPYPHPKILGLVLDPREKARVASVASGSQAEKDGFRPGDEIASLGGQSVISIADIQWVLHGAPASGSLKATVIRGGAKLDVTTTLAPGWREKGDLSWRSSSWDLRRMTTGGMVLEDLDDAARAKAGFDAKALALRVKSASGFGEFETGKKAGFREGDVMVAAAGGAERLSESGFMGGLALRTKPGDRIPVTVLREGKKLDLTLPMQ